MNIKINGKDIKLKFGVKFCRVLDEMYKVDYQGLEFGMGVNMAHMSLAQYNPTALSNVIKAASAHKEFSQDEVDDAIDTYAEENDGLGKLFKDITDEMGKSPTVKATIEHFKKTAVVENNEKE